MRLIRRPSFGIAVWQNGCKSLLLKENSLTFIHSFCCPMKTRLLFIPLLFFSLLSYAQKEGEVIYHVFQRSFFDSNGDTHGDLKGLADKLAYLQELGVTSILTLPTCESVFYHNYFSGDFIKIDPRYGSM
jgi:hypothetical protein